MALTQISTQGIKDGTITGSDLATNVDLVDNQNLRLGTGNDLKLSHDGTDSIITHDTGSGLLRLNVAAGGEVRITKSGPETMGRFIPDGAVELYHNGNKKVETTSSGVSITGSHNVSGGYSVMHSGSAVLQLFSSLSSFACIKDFTDDLRIRSGKTTIMNEAQNETLAKFTANGAVELYHNNDKKFETTSSGVAVTGQLTIPDGSPTGNRIAIGDSQDLALYHNSSNSFLVDRGTGPLYIRGNNAVRIEKYVNDSAGEPMIIANADGAVELYYDNEKMFETEVHGVKVFDNNESVHVRMVTSAGDAGYLYGASNNNIALLTRTGAYAIRGVEGGTTELYHNGGKKLETGSDHVSVQGSGSDASGVSYIKFKTGNGSHRANIGKTSAINGRLSIMNLDNDSVEFGTGNSVKLELQNAGHLIPSSNNSYDLGGTSNRWANVYTNDLNLSNEGGSNDVDGTWGSYTIQEGAEDLFLINKRSGKKYKFNLTEVS